MGRRSGPGYWRRAALLVGTLVALSPGCGYHLAGRGTTLPDHVQRIAIPMFENLTEQPDIAQRLTEGVVNEFVARGGYTTTSNPEEADALLRGTVVSYRTLPLAITSEGNATRYEIVIQVRADLRDLSRDELLWEDDQFVFRQQYTVEAPEGQYFDRSIVAIERVSRDFARSVVATILEGF